MSDAPQDASAPQRQVIARRAGIVATGTLSSRLLGAVRDGVIAATFSLPATDAFFVAWTIPNTLRRVLGEGAVSAAFIPVFTELRETEGPERAKAYFRAFAGLLSLALVATAIIGVAFAPFFTTLYASGYQSDPQRFATTEQLTRLLFPYVVFAGWAALLMGVLNSLARFAVPAFAPALLNVSMICAPVVFVPIATALGLPMIAGLALAALVGGLLQVLVQLPETRRVGMLAWPRLTLSDPAVRRSMVLMGPLILGSGVYQINILLSRLFASYLPTGSQSYLYYGQRLVEIPQGMFAIAIASAALPSLAALRSRQEHDEARATFRYSMRLALFVALPASAALAALAEPTVTVVFGRGQFVSGHIEATAASLVWMAGGVWAVACVHVVTRMFYAYNDTRTPVLAGALNLVLFVAISLSFMGTMKHEAIALATSAAAVGQLLLLLGRLGKLVGPLAMGEVLRSAVRALAASLLMGAVVHDVANLGDWEQGGNDPRNLMVYAGLVIFGGAVYLAAAKLLGSPEVTDASRLLARRRKTT